MDEIKKHTKMEQDGTEVLIYKSKGMQAFGNPLQTLQRQEIILTTYSEVAMSYPKCKPPVEMTTPEEKLAWWRKEVDEKRGPLHRMMFHRIVLDEAHLIKNRKGITSIACRSLMAHHRWCLSGTPILNSLKEFWSLFRFLQLPNSHTFEAWAEYYFNDESGDRPLQAMLRKYMLRRTHANQLMGVKLLALPTPSQQTISCEFNDVERSVYDIVKRRFVEIINQRMAESAEEFEESWKRHYSHVFIMYLRLRQLTGHILMVQETMRDLLLEEDIAEIRHLASQETRTGSGQGTSIKQLRKALGIHHNHAMDDAASESQQSTAGFGIRFRFDQYLDQLAKGRKDDQIFVLNHCALCSQEPDDPQITDCGHLYCYDCMDRLRNEEM